MSETANDNCVMGVASGMPVDDDLLTLLLKYRREGAPWQATLIGRQEIWVTHQKAAELGGMLRTGVEDTFSSRTESGRRATAPSSRPSPSAPAPSAPETPAGSGEPRRGAGDARPPRRFS